jgi:hypothetical protein
MSVGLVLLGAGLVVSLSSSGPSGETASATGIVAAQNVLGSGSARQCAPAASFTVGGHGYLAGSAAASSTCPAIGAHVAVAYDPSDPARANVVGSKNPFTWALAGFGAVVLVAAGVLALRRRSGANRARP